jgi:hypothetical protein
MKHNKKRNTAFIYETLSRELTKAIVDKNSKRKSIVVSLVKEHFSAGSVLTEELNLYKILLESVEVKPNIAERLLQETKLAHAQIDNNAVFSAQSRIIAAINKSLGQATWSNFVPNFKSLASVSAIFNTKMSIKKKVLFEQTIIEKMTAPKNTTASDKMKTIDNITYHSFIKKFNSKYTDLLQEQKDLLNRYITSFADEGFELRVYLNEELSRLKALVAEATQSAGEALISQKLEGINNYLEEFRKREFTDIDLNKVLKTQELVKELSAND